MKYLFSRDPKFLSNLFCGCGKPASLGWHLPPVKEKPKKLSKTNDVEVAPKKDEGPSPVGWACADHEEGAKPS